MSNSLAEQNQQFSSMSDPKPIEVPIKKELKISAATLFKPTQDVSSYLVLPL